MPAGQEKKPRHTIGQRLRVARLAAGMTQAELAEASEVSQSTISDIERGERQRPRNEDLVPLADALDVSFRDLVDKPPRTRKKTLLTADTLEFRGQLKAVVASRVNEIRQEHKVPRNHAEAMLARALMSGLVQEQVEDQCKFYLGGDVAGRCERDIRLAGTPLREG
jgi:transcriptional regulator with XRE-family HTH domain